MKLTSKVDHLKPIPDDRNDGSSDWTCTPCGTHLKGSWHHCHTCHLTFPQSAGFDRHRTGDYENRATGKTNTRRCLTVDELTADGWQHDQAADLWRTPPPRKETA